MKKVFLFIVCCMSLGVNAQINDEWDDPYLKPDAPGIKEYETAVKYIDKGDYKKYFSWLIEAINKGNMFAGLRSAHWLLEGYKGSDIQFLPDTAKAISTFHNLAIAGYAPGQFYYSLYCFNGGKIQQDYKYGSQLLMRSAEQGFMPSKCLLANCYLNGMYGITRDVEKGLEMTEECANVGDVQSQYVLGEYYFQRAETPDYAQSIKWLTKAADNGFLQAYNMLAYLYAQGKGAEKNYQKAHKLINEARKKAQDSNKLTWDLDANLLDSDGEFYLMEGKMDEANTIWKQLKAKYPNYVELNKYEVANVFTRKMYEQEQIANKPSIASSSSNKPIIPSVVSDIDENIPQNAVVGNPVFAVIIANENYLEVDKVPYASHDGEAFKKYCEQTLGIPQSNVKLVTDATLNNIKRQLNWLGQVMDVYQGEASIVFYYAGHGIPDEKSGSAYILPVDGVGNDVSTGISLDKLYSDLSSKPAKSVVVLLDACFSGARRDGGMLASARGVAIKAKQNAPKGNMIVLSAAQGDETAYPYNEKGHGMFTYYLLKKLQETKGDVSFGELADYVTEEVKKQSVVTNGKMQTPLVTPSNNVTNWRNWKLR